MNKERRKELNKAIKLLEEAQEIIACVMDEEQEAYDNLPEGIQSSEKGEEMDENVSDMDNCGDTIQDVIDDLCDIVER